MVSVRRHYQSEFPDADITAWLETIPGLPKATHAALERACRCAQICEQQAKHMPRKWQYAFGCYRIGREMVEILAGLDARTNVLVAALLYRSVREGTLSLEQLADEFGADCKRLVKGALRMAAMGNLVTMDSGTQQYAELNAEQQRAVRKMLIGIIDDPGVALIKLAERTVVLYAVKEGDVARRRRVAQEIFDIYAPLANRLGVGQLKWELEDLSFRYLQPEEYHHIAALLAEKRSDREAYVARVVDLMSQRLAMAGIDADVKGRVKHIYGIYQKMKTKGVAFSQVCDIRAIRVLVDDIRDCYAVLGMVHSLWEHLHAEFDDYIANPKANGYQSLHTAVIGPEGKVMEIQIRTHDMHTAAELGVCAHWRYKEGLLGTSEEDYENKIAWLREMLNRSLHDASE